MSQDLLTEILKEFISKASNASALLQSNALSLFTILATIDLVIVYIMSLLEENGAGYKELLRKLPIYGAFLFIIQGYSSLIATITESFLLAGSKAGGAGLTVDAFTNPSIIIKAGYDIIGPVWSNYLENNGGVIWIIAKSLAELASPPLKALLSVMGISEPTSVIIGLITIMIVSILIMACFFVIAIQLFVVQIEFAVIAALGIILVPFGVWDKTAFIFDKIKNSIISFGIKLMFLSTFAGVTIVIVKQIKLPPEPTWAQMMYLLLGIGALAYLAVKIPKEIH